MHFLLGAAPRPNLTHSAARCAGVLAVAWALSGCGSSNSGAPTPRDDGGTSTTDGSSAQDTGTGPGPDSGAPDTGPSCGDVPPSGMQIVSAPAQLIVKGMTYDGNTVLYVDTGAQTLSAVPIGGGKPTTLGAYKTDALVPTTTGALFFPTLSPQTSIGPLSAWTPTAGSSVISTTATAAGGVDMSADGTLVAYFATSASAITTGALTVSTIDGKTQTTLVPNIDLQNCPADAQFVGSTLVAAYCLTTAADGGGAADAGTGPLATVATFSGPSFTQAVVGTDFDPNQFFYSVPTDPSGMQLLLSDVSGLGLYPIAGGSPKSVDPNGSPGLFAPNGDVVYATLSSINRWAAASGTVTQLLAAGTYTPQQLSPDGNWMQLGMNFDSNTGASDMYLASATSAGSATSLWAMTTAVAYGFSTDSKFELFITGSGSFQATTHDLYASPVSGGAPSKIATVATAGTLDGSRLVMADNYMVAGTADLELLDLAKPASKKALVTGADPNIAITANNQIVYSWYCQLGSTSGVWVAPSN